jgi:small subunit ribosomal protein S20
VKRLPVLKSSKKRLRQAQKARLRNKSVRTQLRSTLKRLLTVPSKSEAEALLDATQSVIDKTAQKGVIHRNAAARYKARITRHVAAMEA